MTPTATTASTSRLEFPRSLFKLSSFNMYKIPICCLTICLSGNDFEDLKKEYSDEYQCYSSWLSALREENITIIKGGYYLSRIIQ